MSFAHIAQAIFLLLSLCSFVLRQKPEAKPLRDLHGDQHPALQDQHVQDRIDNFEELLESVADRQVRLEQTHAEQVSDHSTLCLRFEKPSEKQ